FFSLHFDEEEVANFKEDICSHVDSAAADDHITYLDIMDIPNELLMEIFNTCLDECEAHADCMFQSFSLLMHKCATKWAEKYKIIPDYQNGFRTGYHTNNNPFILRCAIEEAKSKSKPLYVAVVDATNAFPFTDHATLWLKLNQLRMGGPLISNSLEYILW
ncbi:hypothetical protein EDD85DRAFT_769399, partial [Armillaria nabsnona]